MNLRMHIDRRTSQKMNFLSNMIIVFILISASYAATPTTLVGTLGAGKVCTAPYQCIEPLYCLPDGDNFKCGKKTCAAADQCNIGQFCNLTAGKCEVKSCKENAECAGQTVCQVNGKCGAKSNLDQVCNRDNQCWSNKCEDGKCTKDGNVVEDVVDGTENVVEDVVDGAGDVVEGVGDAASDTVDGVLNVGRRIGGGGIAGIIIGILLLLGLLAACLYFCCFARRRLSNN